MPGFLAGALGTREQEKNYKQGDTTTYKLCVVALSNMEALK